MSNGAPVIGEDQVFAAAAVIPQGWWLARTSIEVNDTTFSAGSTFYSDGTAVVGDDGGTAAPVTFPTPEVGAPVQPAPSPPSAPGIEQPVIVAGGQSLPPSLPEGDTEFTSAGWGWLPPPQVGMGENEPFPTPVVPPGVMSPWPVQQPALPTQPVFPTGSATAPPAGAPIPDDGTLPPFVAGTLFPNFTTTPPMEPIVLNATQAASTGTVFPDDWVAPPFPIPTTPGVQPIVMDGWGLGAGPGGGGSAVIVSAPVIAAVQAPAPQPVSADIAPHPAPKRRRRK